MQNKTVYYEPLTLRQILIKYLVRFNSDDLNSLPEFLQREIISRKETILHNVHLKQDENKKCLLKEYKERIVVKEANLLIPYFQSKSGKWWGRCVVFIKDKYGFAMRHPFVTIHENETWITETKARMFCLMHRNTYDD